MASSWATARPASRDSAVAGDSGASARAQRPWLQDISLWILLVGPLVAPLFAAIGWPILKPFADAIYLIGELICPKPGVHLQFLGEPVAVCYSCWLAVFGLWAVRLLHGRAGEGFGLLARLGVGRFWSAWEASPPAVKLSVLFVGFIPWAVDVMLWDLRAWDSPHIYMMFAGYLGGLVAGLLVLPAASRRRERRARTRRA